MKNGWDFTLLQISCAALHSELDTKTMDKYPETRGFPPIDEAERDILYRKYLLVQSWSLPDRDSNGCCEMTSKVSKALKLLRAAALIAVVAGAVGSVGLTLYAGHRNASQVLKLLFVLWVLSPFAALLWASLVSKRWSVPTRAALHSLTLVLALGTLAIYGAVALGPPRAKTAAVFVVVPPVSWLLIAIVVPMAALISRRLK